METWVLRRVNLTPIHPWEFITIMSPSGAGKSSLLNVLAMLDDQWRGEFDFDGEAVHRMNRQAEGRPGAATNWDGLSELSPAG